MRNITVALCCGLFMTGCSSFTERNQSTGSFDYVAEQEAKALTLPAGYSAIELSNQYSIPVLATTANSALGGHKLDIRAPALAMAVAPESLISQNRQQTEIVFESFKNVTEFRADLWKKITGFVDVQTYGISMSREGSSLTTRNIESDPFFMQIFGLEEQTLTQQYQFELNVAPQGHRANVAVKLVKHQQQGQDIELNQFAQRRYETRMLNAFLSHLQSLEQTDKVATIVKAKPAVAMELGFDDEQNVAYIIKSPFEPTWEKLAVILPKLGFMIKDRDKTLGTYFVNFEQQNPNYLAVLFKVKQIMPIYLAEGKYQIKLQESGARSVLTIIDNTGEALTADKMAQMSKSIKERFAKKAE